MSDLHFEWVTETIEGVLCLAAEANIFRLELHPFTPLTQWVEESPILGGKFGLDEKSCAIEGERTR